MTWLTVRLFLSSSSYYSLPLYKGEKSLVPNDRHNFSLLTKSQEVSSDRINGQMSQRIFLLQDSFHEVDTQKQKHNVTEEGHKIWVPTYVGLRYRLHFTFLCQETPSPPNIPRRHCNSCALIILFYVLNDLAIIKVKSLVPWKIFRNRKLVYYTPYNYSFGDGACSRLTKKYAS